MYIQARKVTTPVIIIAQTLTDRINARLGILFYYAASSAFSSLQNVSISWMHTTAKVKFYEEDYKPIKQSSKVVACIWKGTNV